MFNLLFYGYIFIFYLIGSFLAIFIAPITNRIIKDKNSQYFTKSHQLLVTFFLSWFSACILFFIGLTTYINNYVQNSDKIKHWLEGD